MCLLCIHFLVLSGVAPYVIDVCSCVHEQNDIVHSCRALPSMGTRARCRAGRWPGCTACWQHAQPPPRHVHHPAVGEPTALRIVQTNVSYVARVHWLRCFC